MGTVQTAQSACPGGSDRTEPCRLKEKEKFCFKSDLLAWHRRSITIVGGIIPHEMQKANSLERKPGGKSNFHVLYAPKIRL